jgi:multiple sugar transport system substrate-binding protein
MLNRKFARGSTVAVAVALGSAMILSGCSAGTTSSEPLVTEGNVTLWSWSPGIETQVDMCMEANPGITVELVNNGVGPAQYEKLRTAFEGKSGFPDLFHIAVSEVPGFVASGDLADISVFGAGELESDYTASSWETVTNGDAIYGLPWDSGPMGFLYRSDVLEQFGIEVPVTWDDFADAARKLNAADPERYLATFSGSNSTWIQGLMWQAGSRPFKVEGNNISISINDGPAKQVARYWDGLIAEGVIPADPDFTDDWYRGLAQGKYASWVTAAWGPSFLQGVAEDSSGSWRAAPMPQWDANAPVTGIYGGSTMAIPELSPNKEAAYVIMKCLLNDEEPTTLFTTQQLLFPSKVEILNDPAFRDLKSDFYGGQAVNATFIESAALVGEGWQFSPIQSFVVSEMKKEIGASAASAQIEEALDRVQATVVEYAKRQGFTVTTP